MRDLKRQPNKIAKVRPNRRKQQRQSLKLRPLLHRLLRIGVVFFSLALLLVGSFFGTQLLLASELFRVEQVSVEGARVLAPEQVAALSDIRIGANSFDLDLGLIGRKISENPWVRQARVRRIFPRRIEIEVEERQPLAIINLGYLYYLDVHGEVFKVLDGGDDLDYPVITGFSYDKVQTDDPQTAAELRRVVDLLDDLRQRNCFGFDELSEVNLSAAGTSLFTLDGAVQIKLGRDNYREKLDRLERIYPQLQPRLSILDYIDLNLDEKVIVRIERAATAAKS